jgi:Pyridoxamine 5'-phosphate oxidase
MTATKVNEEINDEGIRKLFEEKNLVFLATLKKDGSPHNVST